MARRKQLRRGRSHTTSPEASPSASPTPSRPASPPINPTAARSARASHSPSKPPSAASASLGQSPTSLDKQAASCAGPAAASPSPAPAELTAPAVLPSSLPAKAYAFDTSPTGATSDASQANQTCLLSADPSVMHHHAARQATEACVPKGVAGSPSDAELARLQQRSPQSHTAGHVLQHPTGINQRSPVPGTGEGSASRADFVSAVKPHPRTAFAKPGSHQGVILSPQAVVHLHAVKTVMSHRLDFSEDTD